MASSTEYSPDLPVAPRPPVARIASLDQFRGYTMFGMLLVNFLGGYAICPRILKHSHDYCSYADTIMPQFLFAAGFALRLGLSRRRDRGEPVPWGRLTRRVLGLAGIAIAWYTFTDWHGVVERWHELGPIGLLAYQLKRGWFQTLMHIAITSAWILPVVLGSTRTRIIYAVASSVLHLALSAWFNFHWVNTSPNGIDGGPFGFLTWTIPAILGTLACDLVRQSGAAAARKLALVGVGVMAGAWLLSNLSMLYQSPASQDVQPLERRARVLASDPVFPDPSRFETWTGRLIEPPFMPPPDSSVRAWNYWMMSQRGGTITYTAFAGGFAMVVYGLFLALVDGCGFQSGLFRTLGVNSLTAYLLHDVAGWVVGPFFPERTSSVAFALTGFACFVLAVFIPCRLMERRGWYLRV
ncbi:MAG: hypothetical protein KF777_07830 [Planctomycetaceae bacterium]|nr:hypothetical protein [Planctomycetaceae bacterium]